MKHFRILLPLLVLALVLFRWFTPQTVKIYNKTFTVDTKKGTISDREYTYQYTASGDTITIVYPDGSRFWQGESGYGRDENYDSSTQSAYTGGMTLTGAVAKAEESRITGGKIMTFLGALATGYWLTFAPEKAWHFMRYNSLFRKNEMPSEGQVIILRGWGILLLLLSVAYFIA